MILTGLPIPAPITRLAERVRDAGGRAWLVGGGVRDHLMGWPVKDLDVEVHGLPVDALERVLATIGRVDAVGRSFGVLKLRPRPENGVRWSDPEIDVSIPRRDSNAGPGHRGIAVEGDPFMSLDESVRRRDLTINAILVDVLTREVADPAGGVDDLAARVLRAVDPDAFLDDPLRALRVVQFVARTGFRVDPGLRDLCARAPLAELPAERVQGEWQKLLLVGAEIALGLAVARETTALARVFPERVDDPSLDAALDRARPDRDALDEAGARWALMLSVWLAATPPDAAERTLDRLAMFTFGGYRVRDQVLGLLATRDAPTDTDAALRHLSVRAEPRLAIALRRALGPGPWDARLARAEALGVSRSRPSPLLLGRHVQGLLPAGPAMGELLKAAYRAQLDGELATPEQALDWARARIAAGA